MFKSTRRTRNFAAIAFSSMLVASFSFPAMSYYSDLSQIYCANVNGGSFPPHYSVTYSIWQTSSLMINGRQANEILALGYSENQGDVYLTVWSDKDNEGGNPNTDPLLYFRFPGGSSYGWLSDDEGGNLNFKAVIHFNNNSNQWGKSSGVYLYALHYPSNDLESYGIHCQYTEYDPQMHGCYYLELHDNDTYDFMWHN